jgi:hypothetical protein
MGRELAVKADIWFAHATFPFRRVVQMMRFRKPKGAEYSAPDG